MQSEKISKILISEEEIKEKIKIISSRINIEYKDKPLLITGILNGSFIFMADFCRSLTVPCEIAFMRAKSYYSNTVSSGEVDISMDITQDLSRYHVIILEDIIDTGYTLCNVIEKFKQRSPLSIKVITLLDKPQRRVVDFQADISLFTIPDLFVVGYGLDFNEHYRNLPYIAQYNE